jgi:hypothetical protein
MASPVVRPKIRKKSPPFIIAPKLIFSYVDAARPMRPLAQNILSLLTLVGIGCSGSDLSIPIRLDQLRLDVHGPSRTVSFTNTRGGYFLTETNANSSSMLGWYAGGQKLLNDYSIEIDGKPLQRPDVHLAMVWPHRMQRAYPSGVQETVTLLDTVNALVVLLEKMKGTRLTFTLLLPPVPHQVKRLGDVLLVRLAGLQTIWLGLAIDAVRVEAPEPEGQTLLPRLTGDLVRSSVASVMVCALSEQEALRLASEVLAKYPQMIEQRRQRMEEVLRLPYVRTDNQSLDKALAWAIISLDGLVHLQDGVITHGLPTEGTVRVRDCLLSIPGALLVGGRFDDAKNVLRTIAAYQDRDPRSPTVGMIPSELRAGRPIFGAADVTPHFVSVLYEYARHANDTTFMKELYPAVKRSIETSLRHRVDRHYFLRHGMLETLQGSGDAERAAALQALWSKQLQLGAVMAAFVGEQPVADRWNDIANRVGQNFNSFFVSTGGDVVYDYLKPDNTGTDGLHPSLLYTFDLLDHPYKRMVLFRKVTRQLVYEGGIRLPNRGSQVWMNGIWIDLATYFDMPELAFKVTGSLVNEILNGRFLGTLPEQLSMTRDTATNAITVSHAPALAEFVRTFFQSYLGIYVDGSIPRLIVKPQMPAAIRKAQMRIPIETFVLEMQYRAKGDEGELTVAVPPDGKNIELHVAWNLGRGVQRQFDVGVEKGSTAIFRIMPEKVEKEVNGVTIPVRSTALKMVEPEPLPLAAER